MRSLAIFCLLSVKLVLVYSQQYDFMKINITQFPSTVPIYKDYKLEAGGVIVSDKYILCLAHIIVDMSVYHIRPGYSWLDPNPENQKKVAITEFIKHPKYDPNKLQNAITLAKLAESLVFGPNIQPATLPDKEFDSRQSLIIAGWGEKQYSKDLRFVLVKVLNDPVCKDFNPVDPNVRCVEMAKLLDFVYLGTPLLDDEGRVQALAVINIQTNGRSFGIVFVTAPLKQWFLDNMK